MSAIEQSPLNPGCQLPDSSTLIELFITQTRLVTPPPLSPDSPTAGALSRAFKLHSLLLSWALNDHALLQGNDAAPGTCRHVTHPGASLFSGLVREILDLLAQLNQITLEIIEDFQVLESFPSEQMTAFESLVARQILAYLLMLPEKSILCLRVSQKRKESLSCAFAATLPPDTNLPLKLKIPPLSQMSVPKDIVELNWLFFHALYQKLATNIKLEFLPCDDLHYSLHAIWQPVREMELPSQFRLQKIRNFIWIPQRHPMIRVLVLSVIPLQKQLIASTLDHNGIYINFCHSPEEFLQACETSQYNLLVIASSAISDFELLFDRLNHIDQINPASRRASIVWLHDCEKSRLSKLPEFTSLFRKRKSWLVRPQEFQLLVQAIARYFIEYLNSFEADETIDIPHANLNLTPVQSSVRKDRPEASEQLRRDRQPHHHTMEHELLDLLHQERMQLLQNAPEHVGQLVNLLEKLIVELRTALDRGDCTAIARCFENFHPPAGFDLKVLGDILEDFQQAAYKKDLVLCADHLFILTYQFQCLKNHFYRNGNSAVHVASQP
ncbi:MAG: hypothetical protein D6820_11620 [Lentisphaerae bacterium]|nr:MAG: hypothetical protein D6820_11620 [Lentisphaerota bacterium]